MQSELELEDSDAAEPILNPPSKRVMSDIWEYFGFTLQKHQKDETDTHTDSECERDAVRATAVTQSHSNAN